MAPPCELGQSFAAQAAREKSLQGPRLTPTEAVMVHKYATASTRGPIEYHMPKYDDGDTEGFHSKSCWMSLRQRLWTGWAVLLQFLDRSPLNALDVTDEEVEANKHVGSYVCLCAGEKMHEYQMMIDVESGFPMMRCTALGEQMVRGDDGFYK